VNVETKDWARLLDTLEAIHHKLDQLGERVAALEADVRAKPAAAAAAAPAQAQAEPEGLGEELVLVLGAAIAAFLGKKPRIRQIRVLGTAAWAQQGRVIIQASHALPVRHG
jgi:methylmalonyl-CoA carboxyltransferase large subunit